MTKTKQIRMIESLKEKYSHLSKEQLAGILAVITINLHISGNKNHD